MNVESKDCGFTVTREYNPYNDDSQVYYDHQLQTWKVKRGSLIKVTVFMVTGYH